jgi:uncharacterized membrane-anchored protein
MSLAPRAMAFGRPPLAAKVPEITVLFWVIKVLTTGMGEAMSDFLANSNILAAVVVGLGGMAAMLWWQLRTRRYLAPVYWSTVVMVAVFGTMASDGVHLLGLPYAATTACYALVVVALLTVWHRREGTLSIHSITTRRREVYYWSTVLATFALGTAAGDLTADELHLGYLPSALLFAAAIVLPLVGWRFLRLNGVVAFWAAYLLTRPLGASVADWFGKSAGQGSGLGYGDGTVATVTLALIAVLVGYLAVRRNDVQRPQRGEIEDKSEYVSVGGSVTYRG